MDIKKAYDVIIVGAGPAGSVAAREIAEAGLDVLLIEKDREVGVPVRCAEGVRYSKLIKFMPPDQIPISTHIMGIRVIAPNQNMINWTASRFGGVCVLERSLFDKELAYRAGSSGANIFLRCCATGLILRNGVVCGIKAERMGQHYEIESKIVIGADGIESRVGRWAGLSTNTTIKNTCSCAQYLVGNLSIEQRFCDLYLGREIAPGGYAWVFPKGNGKANVGLGVSGRYSQKKSPVEYLNMFIEKFFPNSFPLTITVGSVPMAPLREIVSSGLMLVGDAARQVNPLTGGGIIQGMTGGREAAVVAVEAFKAQDFSKNFLKKYSTRWKRLLGRQYVRNYYLYQFISILSDKNLNKLVDILERVTTHS